MATRQTITVDVLEIFEEIEAPTPPPLPTRPNSQVPGGSPAERAFDAAKAKADFYHWLENGPATSRYLVGIGRNRDGVWTATTGVDAHSRTEAETIGRRIAAERGYGTEAQVLTQKGESSTIAAEYDAGER